MRRTLTVAAIALAATATAQAAAVKPVVVTINVVNGRPIGGIKRPSVKKGRSPGASSSSSTTRTRYSPS